MPDTRASGAAQPELAAVSASESIYNERGVIAESYYDLQGLAELARARSNFLLPKASGAGALRAVFQGADIALLNASDLLDRCLADLEANQLDKVVVKLAWARGFQRVLATLSFLPERLGIASREGEQTGVLRIRESAAYRRYAESARRFDDAVLALAKRGDLDFVSAIRHGSLENTVFNIAHLSRLGYLQTTIWERNLADVEVPSWVPSYEQFVGSQALADAVSGRVLIGDTFFTQFRGLHQIPELLGEEINDFVEWSIQQLRAGNLQNAAEGLRTANILMTGVIASMPPIADNLATSDYHEIRENLGLTSGSHSVCLRFDMFTNLYEQLWEEFSARVRDVCLAPAPPDVAQAIRELDRLRATNSHCWMLHLIGGYCLEFRASILHWRDEHLNLPRNNLGGGFTKSLTGSPDAVGAVKHMRDSARQRDPMLPLVRARGVAADGNGDGELTQYINSAESLDTYVLESVGEATRLRFQNVQDRTGYFSNRCPFTAPPKRRA